MHRRSIHKGALTALLAFVVTAGLLLHAFSFTAACSPLQGDRPEEIGLYQKGHQPLNSKKNPILPGWLPVFTTLTAYRNTILPVRFTPAVRAIASKYPRWSKGTYL